MQLHFHTAIMDIDGSQTYASCVTGKELDSNITWQANKELYLDGLCVKLSIGDIDSLKAVSCDSKFNLICQV